MKHIGKYYYLITAVVSFTVYMLTIAPTVIQIDSGELAAVQCLPGIAHPTGYPLFTIIGYLFSLVPLPFSKIFQLNLLASVYCASAAALFTITSKLLLDNINNLNFNKVLKGKANKKKVSEKNWDRETDAGILLPETVKIVAAVFSGLSLAFSRTFWFQSTSVEVYSLHLLLTVLILLSLLKAYLSSNNSDPGRKYWLFLAFALALGFANHMTTMLILPGLTYLYFDKNRFGSGSFKQILIMLLVFFPVLILFYSYLPFLASDNPVLNWGNPVNFENLLRHISGKQYQVWLFSSTEAASKQLGYFLENLPGEFFITLILSAAGLIFALIKAKKFFIFNSILFLTTVLYSINYDINDIDSYFLLAYISLGFFTPVGVVQIWKYLKSRKENLQILSSIVFLILSVQLFFNFNEVNQNQNYAYEDYTKALLNSLPENSIVFSYQWDYFISASYYFRYVENFRDDVRIIDKELLRRSWYYNQLDRNYKGLLSGVRTEVNRFKEALKPFEREENYNAGLLENLFRRIMTGLVTSNTAEHDYFIAPEIADGELSRGEFQLPEGYRIVPHLFLFKVVQNDNYVEAPLPEFKIRFSDKKDKYAESMGNIIGGMLVRRALYELKFNHAERAGIYAKKTAADFPQVILPPILKKLIND